MIPSQISFKTAALLIICAVLLAYAPFLNNQLFWDDEQFIYNNYYVKTFDVARIFTTNTIAGAGELSNYYRPLTTLSFAIDYQFWGDSPIGYHLTNMLAHLAAALLLLAVLRTLKLPHPAALGISLLFTIHPIQTEAVAYANSRGDSLYSMWALMGIYSFLQVINHRSNTIFIYDQTWTILKHHWAWLALSCFVASILSKEIGIASVGLWALLLTLHLVKNSQQNWRRTFREQSAALWVLAGAFAIASTYLALRFTVLRFQPELNLYGDSSYGTSMLVRLLTFSKSLWLYGQLLLAPVQLHMERVVDVVESLSSPWPWASVLLIVCIIWAGWLELKRRQTTWIWLGLGWFLIMMAPISGILPINGMFYEHWLYLPMVGFWLIGVGLYELVEIKLRWIKTLFIGACIGLLILTWRQNYIWANPIRFYTYTLRFSDAARLHNNLGMAYAQAGDLPMAVNSYRAAIERDDQYPQTHHNLANALVSLSEYDQAQAEFKRALEISPGFAPSIMSLAQLQYLTGDASAAATTLERALELAPQDEALRQLLQTLRSK